MRQSCLWLPSLMAIIPPTYPEFLDYRAEHEPDAQGSANINVGVHPISSSRPTHASTSTAFQMGLPRSEGSCARYVDTLLFVTRS
jgi:hypothetical protein